MKALWKTAGLFFSQRGHREHREAVRFVFLMSVLLKASFDRTQHLRPQILLHFL
jgi:hypothetical protein